ncbi:MAG: hypothetical protein IKC95_05005 [Oscillospiraceae bacterium]|nr:hypothetical protein [Oscillospiraceae bacterium]
MDKKQRVDALIEMIAQVDDPKAIRALFADMCTAKELENMAERCYAARLLMEGKTYAQVMELSDISSATLSRVSRCVQYGEGYRNLLR